MSIKFKQAQKEAAMKADATEFNDIVEDLARMRQYTNYHRAFQAQCLQHQTSNTHLLTDPKGRNWLQFVKLYKATQCRGDSSGLQFGTVPTPSHHRRQTLTYQHHYHLSKNTSTHPRRTQRRGTSTRNRTSSFCSPCLSYLTTNTLE